jgi:hypothetical protein
MAKKIQKNSPRGGIASSREAGAGFAFQVTKSQKWHLLMLQVAV